MTQAIVVPDELDQPLHPLASQMLAAAFPATLEIWEE